MADADTARVAIALARLLEIGREMKAVVLRHEPRNVLIDRFEYVETFLRQEGFIE